MGEIRDFTGISSPYEIPNDPEIIVNTGSLALNDSVRQILKYLSEKNLLNLDH